MDETSFLLELLKLIFGWPFMTVVIVGTFADEIRFVIQNADWKFRAGSLAAEATQQQRNQTAPPVTSPPIPSGEPDQPVGTATTARSLEADLEAKKYRFLYLDSILVPRTRLLLGWLETSGGRATGASISDSLAGVSLEERIARMTALEANQLIARSGESFEVTPLGREMGWPSGDAVGIERWSGSVASGEA